MLIRMWHVYFYISNAILVGLAIRKEEILR